MEYDLSDKEIRYMVEANHRPVEPERLLLNNGSAVGDDTEIRCRQDGQKWPCAIIGKLREWSRGMGPDRVTL